MSDEKLDVTVLMMCFNEQEALPKVIGDIRAAFEGKKYSYEILVVDDGSTDNSGLIAQELSCRVIRHEIRRGAGAAFKTGINAARGSIIAMLDADGTYTAADIPKLLEYFPEFDQVNGARTSEQGDLPLLRAPAKWLVRMFVSLLAQKKIPDLQTGLKSFKRDIMLKYLWIIPDKFSHCPLITLAFLCNGFKVKYIPTQYHKRIGGQSKFHPLKDTAYVLMQVCRVMMHFSPVIRNLVNLAAVATIVGIGMIVYSGTFFSSFHFDDQVYIVNNYAIRNLHNLLSYWIFYPCRYITFLSLFLNYHFNGVNVFGYHLFNLGVHLASAVLVWWLVLLTLSTPALKEDKIARHSGLIAFFAGLVFVSHPLQTEAVTYIWQRTASMAALFYLASLCLYIRSRSLLASPAQKTCYIASLLIAIVAMFTKENTVTLPLMILLYEIIFLGNIKKLNWTYLAPFLLTLFIIPVTIFLTKAQQFQSIQRFIHEPGGTSPYEYLLTQFRVIATYIKLLFLPINQNLDYDFSISKSFFQWPTWACFLLLAGVLYTAKLLYSKYRLVAFSILWFFLTLALESSAFPLRNVIFEHRLYLPMAGFSLFLVSGAYYLFGTKSIKTMVSILTVIVVFNSFLTYQRNKVWNDELTLWSDAIQKSPHKARPVNNRGFAYYQVGNIPKAMVDYNKAIEIDPKLADAYVGRGLCYADLGNFPAAIADYNKAIKLETGFAEAYNNRGTFYLHQGNIKQAIADLSKAIDTDPLDVKAYYNRGVGYAKEGKPAQAISDYSRAIKIDSSFANAYYNRGLSFAQQKYFRQAVIDFNITIKIDPNYADAYNNRGIIYAMQGKYAQAIADFNQAIKINPKDQEAIQNRAHAYSLMGQNLSDPVQ